MVPLAALIVGAHADLLRNAPKYGTPAPECTKIAHRRSLAIFTADEGIAGNSAARIILPSFHRRRNRGSLAVFFAEEIAHLGASKSRDFSGSGKNRRRNRRESRDFGALSPARVRYIVACEKCTKGARTSVWESSQDHNCKTGGSPKISLSWTHVCNTTGADVCGHSFQWLKQHW